MSIAIVSRFGVLAEQKRGAVRRVGDLLRSALGLFVVLTALYGLVVPTVVGWLTVDYSPSRQYISELGAVIWLAVALPRGMRLPVLLLLGIGIGNLGAVAGGALVWLGRRGKRPVCLYAGLGVWASLYLMGGPGQEMRGFWQRVAEVLLYSSLPYFSWLIRRASVVVRQGIP